MYAEHYVQGKWFVQAYDKTYQNFWELSHLNDWHTIYKKMTVLTKKNFHLCVAVEKLMILDFLCKFHDLIGLNFMQFMHIFIQFSLIFYYSQGMQLFYIEQFSGLIGEEIMVCIADYVIFGCS